MENIVVLGCREIMDDMCIGCARCLVGLERREGEFARYKGQEANIVGLVNCGGCPGEGVAHRLALMKLWNAPLDIKVHKVHVGTCVMDHCPHRELVLAKVRAKAGVEVVEGTHPYRPVDVFAD